MNTGKRSHAENAAAAVAASGTGGGSKTAKLEVPTSLLLDNRGGMKRGGVGGPKATLDEILRVTGETNEYRGGQIIEVAFDTANQCRRLLPNGLTATVEGWVPNPKFGKNDADAVTKAREEDSMNSAVDAFYFSPLILGASMIEGVDVLINGGTVQSTRENFLSCYSALNRIFCTSNIRKRYLGHEYMLINDEQLSKVTDATADPSFKFATEMLHFGKEGQGEPMQLPGFPDGVFGGRPINWGLVSMTEKQTGKLVPNEPILIPPNQKVRYRFRLCDPIGRRMCWGTGGKDPNQLKSGELNADEKSWQPQGARLDMTELSLSVSASTFEGDKVNATLAKGNTSIFSDIGITRLSGCPAQREFLSVWENLPPTGLVYVAFVMDFQIFGDHQRHKAADATKFVLPEHLSKISFFVNGDAVLFPQGLSIPAGLMAHNSKDARLFYEYMVNRGLTDLPFDAFFPRKGQSLIQAFPIDLRSYQLTEYFEFKVEAHFHEGKSPTGLYLFIACPTQCPFEKKGNERYWRTNLTLF